MVLYTLFSLSLFLLLLISKGIKGKSFFALSFCVLILYWGLSYIDVPDTSGYMLIYDSLNGKLPPDASVTTHFEGGFLYLMWLFKRAGANYYLFQFFLFSIESFLVFQGIKKLGVEYRDLGSIVCLLGFWLPIVLLGALRQGVAIAIFIFSLHTLLEKKYGYFILLNCISFFFHKSSIFLLVTPLWFLLTNIIIQKRILLLILFVFVNVLHLTGFTLLTQIDSFLSLFFSDIADANLSVSEFSIYSESNVGESNFGFLKLLEVDFCFLVALLLYPENDNKAFQLLASLFILFFILNMLVGGIIIHRITYYLQIPYFLLLIRSFKSVFALFNTDKQGQYALTFIYIYLTNIVLSKPFSASAIHEYHIFDVLGL